MLRRRIPNQSVLPAPSTKVATMCSLIWMSFFLSLTASACFETKAPAIPRHEMSRITNHEMRRVVTRPMGPYRCKYPLLTQRGEESSVSTTLRPPLLCNDAPTPTVFFRRFTQRHRMEFLYTGMASRLACAHSNLLKLPPFSLAGNKYRSTPPRA